MGLVTLKDLLATSIKEKYAVGGFVTFDYSSTEAIIKAAEKTGGKAIVMVPWGMIAERERRDEYLAITADMIRNSSADIALHLDHGANFKEVMLAIHAGFSSVMYDGSALPFDENIANTKKVVEAAHACGVSVEGEIGHVGGAEGGALISGGLTADSSMYTTVDEAVKFYEETGVDALAVAFGTVHGIVKGTPKLDLERLAAIRDALNIRLVMHGGSGLSDEAFRSTVENGVNKINYFTEMSLTAANSAKEFLADAGDKPVHMMEITGYAYDKMEKLIEKQIRLFRLDNLEK